MKQKLTNFVLAFALLFAPVVLSPVAAYADCPNSNTSKGQVLQGAGETGSDCSGAGVGNLFSSIVNILSYIVGVAAIIMIMISGLKYVTSGGDSGSVSSAKNTLIYALVGLLIAALAQVLVRLVLDASS